MSSSIRHADTTGFARPRATVSAARAADRPLAFASTAWVAVAVVGPLIFAACIVVLHGRALALGLAQRWNAVVPPARFAFAAVLLMPTLLIVVRIGDASATLWIPRL